MANKKEKKRLMDTIYKDLKKYGNYESISKGAFDDGSGAWIEAFHKVGPNENGKRYCQIISFNGDGTEIDDINIYEEKMTWEDDQKKID